MMFTVLSFVLASFQAAQAPPAPPPAPGLTFNATLSTIRIQGRPGQVVTRLFHLTLDRNQPRTRFRAYVEDWWRSEDGGGQVFAQAGTLRRSCGPWVTLNPVESAVSAGETLTVRITVSLPTELAAGGYWCVLSVDEVPDPLEAVSGIGVRFVASVSTGIFVDVDPVERAAEVMDLDVAGEQVLVRLRNDGNTPLGVEGRVEFLAAGTERPVATAVLPRAMLLTEPSRFGRFSATLPPAVELPSGRYLVRVLLDIGTRELLGAERDVIITRTPPHVESR